MNLHKKPQINTDKSDFYSCNLWSVFVSFVLFVASLQDG